MPDKYFENEAGQCMKCGFCMSVCPVYDVEHVESHVARGRNMLINWSGANSLEQNRSFKESLYFCLLCRRCESICPARVFSAAITLAAREQIVAEQGISLAQRILYRGILKHRSLMARLLGLAVRLLPGLSDKDGRPLRHLADAGALLSKKGIYVPPLSSPFLSERLPVRTLPPQGIPIKGEVAFFPGCAAEFFFADVAEDTVMVLAMAGFEVVWVADLSCCGLAVHNAGDAATARLMAAHNLAALKGFDHIVTGCATCASALKDYQAWFSNDDKLKKEAADFSKRVMDFSEFLDDQGFEPNQYGGARLIPLRHGHENTFPISSHRQGIPTTKAGPRHKITVTYHDPCHLRWHHGIIDQPRNILKSIKGINFVEMNGADKCCGLGGAFGLTHRDVSLAIQEKKMAAIKKTGAQAVATSCPGCMIQLRDGARRHNLPVEVLHISQLLNSANP